MFQAVYSWATVPTDLLDGWMASGIDAIKGRLARHVVAQFDCGWRFRGALGIFIFCPKS